MSHLPERNEKTCLNCNSDLHGRYCHKCGQENLEPKESFWHLITHFVYDVTHFDGKFFATLKMLLRRPGVLSREYAAGRRASYLNPIRMYIFTSALFFIIFFSFIKTSDDIERGANDEADRKELIQQERKLDSMIAQATDSAEKKSLQKQLKKVKRSRKMMRDFGVVQINTDEDDSVSTKSVVIGSTNDNDPKTVSQYDSIQKTLPSEKRDGWLERIYMRRKIEINKKYEGRPREFWSKLQEKFLHSIPQMMFVSLPLVAALLQLLYVRRRRQFYYTNHIIFVIHLYIALYILILLSYLFGGLQNWTGWSVFNWITVIIALFMIYYVYKAMRNFYGQSRGKTILKYFLMFLFCCIVFSLLMAVFFLTSALQI